MHHEEHFVAQTTMASASQPSNPTNLPKLIVLTQKYLKELDKDLEAECHQRSHTEQL